MAQEKYYKGKPIKDIKASDLTPEEYAAFMKHSIEERKIERLRQMSYGEIKQLITERYGEDPKLTELPGYLAKVYIEKHAEYEKAIRQENLRVDKALDILEAKRQADRAKAQGIANRTQATVEVGGQIYTPQNDTFNAVKSRVSSSKTSSTVAKPSVARPATQRTQSNAAVSRDVDVNDIMLMARLTQSAADQRRMRVQSSPNRPSEDPQSPNYNRRYASFMKDRREAIFYHDVDMIRELDVIILHEFGVKLRPTEFTKTTSISTNPPTKGCVKAKGNPNKGGKVCRRMSLKQIFTLILMFMLCMGIIACGKSCDMMRVDANGGSGFYETIETTTANHGHMVTTPEADTIEKPSLTQPIVDNAQDLAQLIVDMQGKHIMSSKGAKDLAAAVTKELQELCALADEDLPDSVTIESLLATMFTENGFRTQETTIKDNDLWVGATQVSEEAVGQVMVRVEKFYNTCMKEINNETDPARRQAMIEQLESNFYVQNFYKTNKSKNDIWRECVTNEKYATAVAQCVKLDYLWRYYGSMSKLDDDVAGTRSIMMYNAGEGNVRAAEDAGLIKYAEDGSSMSIHLDKLPTKAELQDSSKVQYYCQLYGVKDKQSLEALLSKYKEMFSYTAKVSAGANIVLDCIADNTVDNMYSLLDKNNTYIGPNENRDASNFQHYTVLDKQDYISVDSKGLEYYIQGQGYTADLELN